MMNTQTAPSNLNVRTVQKSFALFIEKYYRKSDNTGSAYEKDVNDFFLFMRNKPVSQLREEDLYITIDDVLTYRNYLESLTKGQGEPKYQPSSINRKIQSVRSFYNYLNETDWNVKMSAFKDVELPVTDCKQAGELTKEEADKMVELAKTLSNGEEKSMLIALALRTSIRLTALCGLDWEESFSVYDQNNMLVTVIDKGKVRDKKVITNEFYEELLTIKKYDNRVFHFTTRTAQNMVEQLVEMMGIKKERNITFHSLKNYGVNLVWNETQDLQATQKQANHKDIKTTFRKYVSNRIKVEKTASTLMDKQVDLNDLHELSKEELINLIMSCNKKTQEDVKTNLRKANNKKKANKKMKLRTAI